MFDVCGVRGPLRCDLRIFLLASSVACLNLLMAKEKTSLRCRMDTAICPMSSTRTMEPRLLASRSSLHAVSEVRFTDGARS